MWGDSRPLGTVPSIDHEELVFYALFSVRPSDKRALAARRSASNDADEQTDVGSREDKADEGEVPERVEMRKRSEDCRAGRGADEDREGTAAALDPQPLELAPNPPLMFAL